MRNFFVLFFLISSLSVIAQKNDKECKKLTYGSFEIHDKSGKIGMIYRKDNVQIEKYDDLNQLTYVRLTPNKCKYLFQKYIKIEPMDSIVFKVKYTAVDNNKYSYIANLDGGENGFKGSIIKTSNKIPKEFKEKFKALKELTNE